jgi:Zn-dependent membrane protease YugP
VFYPGLYFDPLWFIIALPPLLLALYAQMRVYSTYAKYSQVPSLRGVPGYEVARRLLDAAGLYHVEIERVPGNLTDHYDPVHKVLRLSDGVYNSWSVAAVGIVAHEVGHAIQDKVAYAPMRLRASLVPVVNIGSQLGIWLFFIGFLMQALALAWAGVLLFSTTAIFALVTLPVEFDASNRALRMLEYNGFVTPEEYHGARAVLNAAALTYVAALAQSLAQLLYFILRLSGMSRRED